MSKQKPMLRGSTDAETCRMNGWGPGTMIRGNCGTSWTTLKITAIGEEAILTRVVRFEGRKVKWAEEETSLAYREWRRVQ